MLSFFAFKKENASIVSAIISSGPLYTLVLAVLFLGESTTPAQLLGIILLVAGTVAVSLKPRVSSSSPNKRMLAGMIAPAILAAFLFGAVAVFVKYSLTGMNFQESFITRQAGAVIALLPVGFLLLKNNSTRFGVFFPKKKNKKIAKSLLFVGLAEIGVMGSVLLFTLAASLGPVSSVNAVMSTMPLFVVLWMFLLRKQLPFANEEIRHENLKSLLLGTLLIIGGIYLVS